MNEENTRPPIPAYLKRRILVEAGHRCAIPQCRSLVGVDIHHIVPWSQCHKHEYANLIALCPNCHRMAHDGTIDRKAQFMYKDKLRLAHDQFSRFEVDFLFDCYRQRGKAVPWPSFLLVLLNRIMELGFVNVQRGNMMMSIGGLDNSPVYLSLSESGIEYVRSVMGA